MSFQYCVQRRHVLPSRSDFSCTRQTSVFDAKTRSSVLSAAPNRHLGILHSCRVKHAVFLQKSTHSSNLFPVYWDTDSLVIKVSKLVHFRPDFWTFARAVLNSLTCCVLSMDESNFSLYSSLPDLVQQGQPRLIVVIVLRTLWTPRQQEVSRVSAFNPAHLSGRTQDANYVSFQLQSPRAFHHS